MEGLFFSCNLVYDYFEEREDVEKKKTRPRGVGSLLVEFVAGISPLVVYQRDISAFLRNWGYVKNIFSGDGNPVAPHLSSITLLFLSIDAQ